MFASRSSSRLSSVSHSKARCGLIALKTHHTSSSTAPNAFLDSLKSIFSGASKEKARLENQLLDAVKGTKRGLVNTKEQVEAITSAVEALQELCVDDTTTSASLSATWRLVWTSEKETLFILSNASVFGTEAGEVYQVIDVDAQQLQNAITFPPEGAFLVDSAIEVSSPQRMDFQFKSATLQLPSRDITLPPFGKGWFDTVYLSSTLRVSKDSRGDTLIVARDGPPRFLGNSSA